jgi:hypothetical protein
MQQVVRQLKQLMVPQRLVLVQVAMVMQQEAHLGEQVVVVPLVLAVLLVVLMV